MSMIATMIAGIRHPFGLRVFAAAAAFTLAALLQLGGSSPAGAAAQAPLSVTINGQRIDNAATPIKVDSTGSLTFKVAVDNQSPVAIDVSGVTFEGHVVGLPVFRCDALLTLSVAPGTVGEQEFLMDNKCLKDQATGLIPATVTVTDARQAQIGKWEFDLNVNGSLKGIYGLFGIALAAISILSILGGLIGLARHRLSPNRWSRAMRFAIPGIGLGFTIVFALGALGVATPDATSWVPIVGATFVVLGIFGYLSPGPDQPEDIATPAGANPAQTVQMAPGSAMTAPLPQAGQPTQPGYAPPDANLTATAPVPPSAAPTQPVRRITPEAENQP